MNNHARENESSVRAQEATPSDSFDSENSTASQRPVDADQANLGESASGRTTYLTANPGRQFLESLPPERPALVVGIGASAGGLEALEQFFANVPEDTGASFVVIQHLSPDFKSHMDRLLGRVTGLPIEVVADGMSVQPNTVYLIPPGSEMVISNGRLLITERAREQGLSHPIDQFFRSLSQDAGHRAIGIVLSGTGSDGSRGVREVSAAGGLVIAQEPATCRFDSMPRNAQATGQVHLVLSPQRMGAVVQRYLRNGERPEALQNEHIAGLEETGLRRIFQLLQAAHEIDFSHYKWSTVQRRIHRRMEMRGIGSLDEYVDLLNVNSAELEDLYRDLLIGVTHFFRDEAAFEILKARVLPELLRQAGETFRVWVCGCASGEEAYSLAIVLIETIEELGLDLDFKMFATDAHRDSIQRAAAGVFSPDKFDEVSAARLKRFFRRHPDGYHVTSEIRSRIIFAPHNVISDPPFTQMDLVTCRNLLIYFQPPAQRKTLSLFHFSLRNRGVLFLGPSETTGDIKDEFEPLEKQWKVFRKRRDVRLPIELRMPAATASRAEPIPDPMPSVALTTQTASSPDSMSAVYEALLGEMMPPSVLVNERGEVLHAFRGSEPFLRFPAGRPTRELLRLVAPQIKNSVAAAIQHVLKDDVPVRYSGLPHPNADSGSLHLAVRPVPIAKLSTRCLLLQFETTDGQPADASGAQRDLDADRAAVDRIESLEKELEHSRQNLQATIEELETSNEELQATNEEMVAANEELQSTNEELHSVNEELYSVNAEHQKRLAELDEANSDMNHLLATTQVGVVFLDDTLAIRRFTPEVGRLLQLEPHDVGRNIESFVTRLHDEQFIQRLGKVLQSHDEEEWEIESDNGVYLVRAFPYRRGGEVLGVVIALINIDKLRQSERQRLLLEKAVTSVDSGILMCDARQPDMPITFVNNGFGSMTGYSPEETIGRNCRFLQGPGTDPAAIDKMRLAIRNREPCRVLIENYRKDGTPFWNDIYITPVPDAAGEVSHFVGIQNDVSERIQIGESVRQNERTTRLLLDSTAEGIFGIDVDGFCTFCNSSAVKMLGFDVNTDLVGKRIHELIEPCSLDGERIPFEASSMQQAVQRGEDINRRDQSFRRSDGSRFPVEYWCHPIESDGRCLGAVVTFVDDRERRQREHELREARDAAHEANAAKSRFLANMSHELRTPLAAMLGFTKIIQTEYDDAELLEKTAAISRNGDYLLRLVGDVLDLSRIESGKFETTLTSVDTAELLGDIRDTMNMRTEDYGSELRFQVRGELPITITTDTARFRQILINLIANAIKFTPKGIVEVTVSFRGGDDADPGNRLVVEVKDNGIGISEAHQKTLFQPFTQANHTINERFGGSGLGLSITKRLLDALGGSISVASEENVGSRFTVQLPVDPVGEVRTLDLELSANRPVSESQSPTRDSFETDDLSARVLIADDMRDVRFVAKHFLAKAGCEVEVAENGQLAVRAIRQAIEAKRPFDLVLMDVQMPVMDGVRAVQTLRDERISVPIIALTADAMKGTRKRLLEQGFDEYLSKPLNVGRLQGIVRDLVRRGRG